ncbi:putative HTH-type transcriptional regulator MT0088 [Arthrobacter sp. Bi26]|jgi:ArsR family transcriptional regulator|uniref:ArsR/SmtB family transcription factor n=1 Tax=Arthrobacter sp. Bi26 TaxID=2822350 RepID=UPI001DB74F1E|nr:metalloregulator ArsR/SmtB family transcription factor [Arthrobacter sp. Bi26]CAH0294396.1 putative HTH-type transcriptional regulator MT0088 [Arthrobacter sp. Bi26]
MDEFSDFRAPLYEVKANLFKGLAHPVRIRVLELLSAAPEVSVTDMLAATGLEASHLSQHLSVLRRYHLVKGERRALQMFYSLAYPQVADLLSVARLLLNDMLHTTREQLEHSEATSPAAASPLAAADGSSR